MVKTLEQMIKDRLGETEGQKLIDKLGEVQNADELAKVLQDYDKAGEMSVLILIVWAI